MAQKEQKEENIENKTQFFIQRIKLLRRSGLFLEMVFWYSLFFENKLKRFVEMRYRIIKLSGDKLDNSLKYYEPKEVKNSTLGDLIKKVNSLYAKNRKLIGFVKRIEEFNSIRKKVLHNLLKDNVSIPRENESIKKFLPEFSDKSWHHLLVAISEEELKILNESIRLHESVLRKHRRKLRNLVLRKHRSGK